MEKFENLMIDIETLDTCSTAVILSIGAVEFGPSGLGGTFYRTIDINSCFAHGLTASGSTLKWWMEQSREAQMSAFADDAPALYAVLQDFTDAFDWENKKVWANGADFDLPIVGNAFKAVGLQEPWLFYNSRCYRTLKNMIPKAVFNALKIGPGLAHNALDDAIAQALTTIKMLDYQEKCYGAQADRDAQKAQRV